MEILKVRIDLPARQELLRLLRDRVLARRDGLTTIATVNAECLALAAQDTAYRDVLNGFSLNVVDSAGVSLAVRLRGVRRPPRTPGSQLIYDLAQLCAESDKAVFLLGTSQRTASLACERLRQLYPGLDIAAYSPAFSPTPALSVEDEAVVWRSITELRPAVVCVALGMPKQEVWIAAHRGQLEEAGVRVAIGVGGAVAYVAGVFPAPPQWVRQVGMEWLYRLLREPHRRFRRQATRLPRFLALATWEAIRLRLRGDSD